MNPKYQRIADRLRALIAEADVVAALERDSSVGPYIQDRVALNAWLVKVENLIRSVFGEGSAHFRHLHKIVDRGVDHSYEVQAIQGVLTGGLDDLEGGFLSGQEQLVAGVVFNEVLDQARHLVESGFKDPAAVLARTVIEDALRRIARQEGIDDSGKATSLNDALRDKNRYPKPQWRVVQSWLDIGNAAAHGKFGDYTQADVLRMVDDIGRFWAQEVAR